MVHNFIKSELDNFDIELTQKLDGSEGVDFLIGTNDIYLQSIDLDTAQRSIKISKQELGELKDNLFIALVLIIDKAPRVAYIIPSKQLLYSESNTFINNEVSLMHEIEFKYIEHGKPTQNAFVERFNGSYRRGVLNKYSFESLEQVREQTQIWMDDYNHFRSHDALGKIPPIKYAEINSNGANSIRIKNNKFDNSRKLSSSN